MHAVVVNRTGGPEVLEYTEVPDPQPGDSDLLVKVDAAGINFIDTYFRRGMYPRPLPYTVGDEGSGVVESVGSQVSTFTVGDRVAWSAAPGSYADKVVVPADKALRVPDHVSAPEAASVLLQGMTAHYLANSTYPIQSGDVVLIHAGAGGTGLLLTQLAKAKGATVITTVSTDQKEELSRGAGADHVLRYDADVAEEVRKLTDGEGVHATYDGVGKSTFEASLAATRIRGTVALFGAASGPVPPFDLQRLNGLGSLVVTRPTLAHHVRNREELEWRGGEVLGLLADGTLSVRIGAQYPLAEAARAHTDLEARATTGSIVLTP
jgi:NADPH2:quinone reductase